MGTNRVDINGGYGEGLAFEVSDEKLEELKGWLNANGAAAIPHASPEDAQESAPQSSEGSEEPAS